ncbi:RNAligase [Actinidia rufa]|uniref:RNAligase n=1 Tax=Actinidia rufa TaxID=165716 RepID=A0A7J0EGZ8_9ERIC|nr:RNAligase [Actinidia rufa]
MSVSQRVVNLAVFSSSTSSASPSLSSRTFLFFRSPFSFSLISRTRFIGFLNSVSHSTLPQYRRIGGQMEQVLKEKPNSSCMSLGREMASATTVEDATNRLNATSMAENSGQTLQLGSVGLQTHVPVRGQQAVWKPKAYGTASEATPVEVEKAPADRAAAAAEKSSAALSKLFKSNIFENFTVDNFTCSLAQIRATFYPKFENEKSDQEVRTRMIEMVSKGLATLEVSLKHSGSLFMYAGHEGGAYAKNSFGNMLLERVEGEVHLVPCSYQPLSASKGEHIFVYFSP